MVAVTPLLKRSLDAFLRNESRSRSARVRSLHTETLRQTLPVLPVDIVELGIDVPADLELRGDTRNVDVVDPAATEQTFTGPAMWSSTRTVGLPPVASFVELQWMTVDLASSSITENEACRPFVIRAVELAERLADPVDVLDANAKIQVVVWTRLLSEQGVDAPASLDPHLDVCCLKRSRTPMTSCAFSCTAPARDRALRRRASQRRRRPAQRAFPRPLPP